MGVQNLSKSVKICQSYWQKFAATFLCPTLCLKNAPNLASCIFDNQGLIFSNFRRGFLVAPCICVFVAYNLYAEAYFTLPRVGSHAVTFKAVKLVP